jgi:Superinfection immunity protein
MNMPLIVGASVHLTGFAALLVIIPSIVLYFLPTIIALLRKRAKPAVVILLNVFLGWTLIGWIAALIMSFGGTRSA